MRSTIPALLAFVLLGASASAITFTTDTAIPDGDATYDGQDVVVEGCTLTVDGSHTFASLALLNGAVLTHSPFGDGANPVLRLDLAVSGDCLVDVSSRVNVNGRGYACLAGIAYGPGAGTGTRSDTNGGGGGGAYGGNGGAPESAYAGGRAYGSPSGPAHHGSAGGAGYAGQGGSGGGYVRLDVGGSLRLDGQVSANGVDGASHSYGASGGGSGGGVWLTANHFSGTGQITADGGRGHAVSEEDSGGGGGGRVAVHYRTSAFAGALSARGAAGGSIAARCGGAGSVFLMPLAESEGRLTIENGGLASVVTPWINSEMVSALVVSNRATLELLGDVTLAVEDEMIVGSQGTLVCRVTNNSAMVNDLWAGVGPTITSAVFRVEAEGLVTASGQGYTGTTTAGNGPGGGTGTRNDTGGGGGGGGHGGRGGNPQSPYAGGDAYDSVTQPLTPGSAGGAGYASVGGAGGGAVKIVATRLELEGAITADGLSGAAHTYGASGGGAGGSLWLQVGAFSGAGLLSANGGNSFVVNEEDGGGGAGGRIAIYYSANSFNGQIQAYGGLSGSGVGQGQGGGAGTIYIQSSAQTLGDLIIDNRDALGALTPWPANVTLDQVTVGRGGNLEIRGGTNWTGAGLHIADGGAFHLSDAATLHLSALTLASNATVYCHGQNRSGQIDEAWAGRGVTIEVQTAAIGAGAIVTANGEGYAGTNTKGNGPGAGDGWRSDNDGGGSGGAYGGNGGAAQGPWTPGRGYGAVANPLELGSAGGAGYAGPGGNGGGALRLIVSGECLLEGLISARGLNGASHGYGAAGGGAGGSVWITAGAFTGHGTVDVSGGNGAVVSEQDSGGGGGGRIAIDAETNSFAGALLAAGGAGGVRGGAGTIHVRTAPQRVGNLLVDNAGLAGARTSLSGQETFDHVQVQNQGLLELLAGPAFSAASITVATNGTLAPQGGATVLAGTLTVEEGGLVQCESTDRSAQVDGQWVGRGPEFLVDALVVRDGGVFTATAQGYSGTDSRGNGPGGGSGTRSDSNGGGGGGGHGGAGSPGQQSQPGGTTYGSDTEPVDLGSAGGAGYAGPGGAGGGAIRIIATGQVVVEGLLTADGGAGLAHSYGASGGGAGGSIWVSANSLSGTAGVIQAVGGQGRVVSEEDSGGGGGGRIALDVGSIDFAGVLSVDGGPSGPFGGQPGTIITNWAVPCVVTPVGGTMAGDTTEFRIEFAEPVTGLTLEDVLVSNGAALGIEGEGAVYVLTVQAMGDRITCVVPAGVAHSAGIPNAQSNAGVVIRSGTGAPTLEVLFEEGQARISWPSEPGVRYQLESAPSLPASAWVGEGEPVTGTGEPLGIDVPTGSSSMRFFRLRIP